MKLVNLSRDTISLGWLAGDLPPKVCPSSPGMNATFFLKGTFRIQPGKVATLWETGADKLSGDRPFEGDPAKTLGYPTDFVPYKPFGEYTITGSAYPPLEDLKSYFVKVRVGTLSKTVEVFGERLWRKKMMGLIPGEPANIQGPTLLSYANAWGGGGSVNNPKGCGVDEDRLPPLEFPGAPITSRTSVVQPAGFAPIPANWALRKAKMGTYNQAWANTRWPWWPLDFDWSYFNAAPPNQWLTGYFVGDEQIEIHGMHPSLKCYKTWLPALRGRCFVTREIEGKQVFGEVPLDLDTITIDMAAEKLNLVWRGRVPIRSVKLLDVVHYMGLVEPLNAEPQDYQALLAKKLIRRTPKPVPPMPHIPDRAEIDGMIAARKAEIESRYDPEGERARQMERVRPHLEALEEKHGPVQGAAAASIADQIESVKAHLRSASENSSLPEAHRTHARETLGKMDAMGGIVTDPELVKQEVSEKIASIRAGMNFPASMNVPAGMAAAEPPKPPSSEEELEAARAKGFRGADLRDMDLSNLDLSGIDFSGAMLTNANLANSNLTGSNFTAALMRGANLGGADLTGADLTKARLSGCMMKKTKFVRACIKLAQLRNLDLIGADFSETHGEVAMFHGSNLTGAKFVNCKLHRVKFARAIIDDADFSGSELTAAQFREAKARRAIFDDCQMPRCKGGFGSDFTDARFHRVNAPGSGWKLANLTRVRFLQATLTRNQFSESQLGEASFDRCDLTKSRFEDSKLEGAKLTNSNFIYATFNRSDLTLACLDGSNLYSCSFWESTLLHATWFGANIKKTKLALKS